MNEIEMKKAQTKNVVPFPSVAPEPTAQVGLLSFLFSVL
jgi:hypothetical protein